MLTPRHDDADVAAIIGTRPEAIKMAPVLAALKRAGVDCALVGTGQHRSLDLPGAGIPRTADAWLPLDPRGLDADAMCGRIEILAQEWIETRRPALVLVQGDTNSALGAARAARRCGVCIGHVEAGLRTFDRHDPWPEERNRVEIDGHADLLFAPTRAACRNLAAEGVAGQIILSGNSGIDALVEARRPSGPGPQAKGHLSILVTVHRRENRGAGMVAIGEALGRIGLRQPNANFIALLHPNAQTRDEMIAATRHVPRLGLLEPQAHAAMVQLMLESRLILTDSGGLQEEAAALGRPVLILRTLTERPEVVDSGNAVVVGTDPERIVTEALRVLQDPAVRERMSRPAFPYGTGGASRIIAETVAAMLAELRPARPRNLAPLDPPIAPA